VVLNIDKKIHAIGATAELGKVKLPDGNWVSVSEKIDYCMLLGGKKFLGLNPPEKGENTYVLFWRTFCNFKQFYLPSIQFYRDAKRILSSEKSDWNAHNEDEGLAHGDEEVQGNEEVRGEGEARLYVFGKKNYHLEWTLEQYLRGDTSLKKTLDGDFSQIQGNLEIITPHFKLSLGQYTKGKRVIVSSPHDLSESLAPLAFKTYPYDFKPEDLESVRGAVSYFLREKVFQYKYTLH
jgi:hypothetical protein